MDNDNTNRVRLQEIKPLALSYHTPVKLIRQGDVHAEVIYMARGTSINTRKLSKTEYVVLSTGEVKEYKLTDGKHREALRKTFQNLRYLIRTNFSADDPHQKFITLTYAENMQDSNRLYKDFEDFMKRLKRHCKHHPLQYIVVAEPQERGAWHMHLMLKSAVPGLWIDKDKLTKLWGHGMTEIAQLKGDDVGNYYVAYFTSISAEARELTNNTDDPTAGNKAYIKGGRLGYYPKCFRFYRCSRNIVRPSQEDTDHGVVVDEYGKPVRTQAYELIKEFEADAEARGERFNLIQRESFRKKSVEEGE